MPDELNEKFRKDERVWETRAHTYEEYIVGGHPDVRAYEEYEEKLIDQILHHLISTHNPGCPTPAQKREWVASSFTPMFH